VAGSFLKQIERARAAATQPARPAEKPAEQMTSTELDEAMRLAKVEVVEANRALAQAAADERTRPATTLSQVLGGLQKSKRRSWR
jgi:ethanolamine utilization microcompartment shell protein EutL